MIDGLALSENVVALRLAERAGLGAGGEAGPPARHLHTDGGRSVPMHGVSRIDDLGVCQSIKSLDRCPEQGVTVPIGEQPRQLLSPEVAAAADQMLAAVLQRGTG